MNDKKPAPKNNGLQLEHKGYQPAPSRVTGGHQPTTSEKKPATPQAPPKKP